MVNHVSFERYERIQRYFTKMDRFKKKEIFGKYDWCLKVQS